MKVKINQDFADLIPNYLKRREQDVESIEEGLKQNDFLQIREIGHKLKGNGASYGFAKLSEIGGKLETAGEEKNVPLIRNCQKELADYLRELEIEFVDCENK